MVQPVPNKTYCAVSEPDILSRIERDEELCTRGCQVTPQPCIRDGQEPPQTPEETGRKEEAVGEQKVPSEAGTGTLPECQEDVLLQPVPVPALRSASAIQNCPGEQAKPRSKKKQSKCSSNSLLMGDCRRGYVREWSHPCTECGKRFRLKINLIIHQRSHAKEGPYECTVCEISFADKSHLVWGNTHPELRIGPRKKLCRAPGSTAHSLGNRTHAGGAWLGQTKEEQDTGNPSRAHFSPQSTLRNYTKRPLKCDLCNKFLSCPSALQRHLQTHSEKRAYKCNKCQEFFPQKKTLIIHRRVHSGRSPGVLWCSYCGKTFSHPSNLTRHQRIHTGERPYKCSECDKSYRRKDYLLNHLRRHSGEGLFQCHLCRKRFVLRRSLIKHQESHVQETQLTVGAWPCAEVRESVVHSR
uniref:C2H2-type domain-containing protein n=1 Tax=Anser brachyrhynchus TaxID=132585 RepID=A0A8B9BY32_9AVES